jgi:rRNA maturation protein Nop10
MVLDKMRKMGRVPLFEPEEICPICGETIHVAKSARAGTVKDALDL